MIISGKLIECKRTVKEYDKKRKSEEKLFISLAESNISREQFDEIRATFADAGKNFTPEWVKNYAGYVNVSTKFELPFRDINGNQYDSIEDAIADGLKWMGADVKLCINIKEGAIYPVAIKFLTEGKSFNPFAEFDEE